MNDFYYLMNKDKELLLFHLVPDPFTGGQRAVTDEKLVPAGEFPPGFDEIGQFIESRNYAKHKNHLKKWLAEWGMDTMQGFLDVTHGLSLNDTLWFRKKRSGLSWNDVSLYRNDFSDVAAHTAFETGLHGLRLSSTSPEFTSEGSFAKCWIREDDIYLYKKNGSGMEADYEAYSEYYAGQLAGILCKDSVSYDLTEFKGSVTSRCRMFTSESVGFMPLYKYLDGNRHYSYQEILELMRGHGLEEDYRRLIVLDGIIFNPDRHFGNLGFLVDNETFDILGLAPAFDHNMALFSQTADLFMTDEFIRQYGHKMGGRFEQVSAAMLTRPILRDLEDLHDFALSPHGKYDVPEERFQMLNRMVRRQISALRKSGIGYSAEKVGALKTAAQKIEDVRAHRMLDVYVASPESAVRAAVAREGYGLDILISDPDIQVRIEVARQEYGLEKLVTDPAWEVRAAVAENNHEYAQILLNDENALVRNVAKECICLQDLSMKKEKQ